MIFEKMKLVTPLHLGAAETATVLGGKQKSDGGEAEPKKDGIESHNTTAGGGGGISSGKLLNMVSSDASWKKTR